MSPKNEILLKLNKLYSITGYMSQYGSDVWITAIICILFTYMIYRYYIINILEVIRSDWQNQKCNPLIMPFAGFINKPTNESNFEFTANNFSTCVFDILKYISEMSFNPLQSILSIINIAVKDLIAGFNALRGLFDNLRNLFSSLFEQIYAIISNLMIISINTMINIKDMLSKTSGVLTSALYLFIGSFMAMEALFLSLVDLMTLILIIIVCIIVVWIYAAVVNWAIVPIPIVGAAAVPVATTWTVTSIIGVCILIALLIPIIIFEVFLLRVLGLSSPPPPSVPGCFSGDTIISLSVGEKKIKDITIGDKLKNGGRVTATIQFASDEQNIYKLHGVYVTGEHRVYHPLLEWIKVKEHPESLYIPEFNEPYVYCLNTDTKVFTINATIFSDWDDVDMKLIDDLEMNCVSHGFLPENFTYEDIHTYLDSGFWPDTKVNLENGLCVPIHEVKVNDLLENNAKVLGVIKITGHDIKQYKHTFGSEFICGSKNIHIDDINLGIINGMQSGDRQSGDRQSGDMQSGDRQVQTQSECSAEPILYHLLTSTKFFTANSIRVNDYNYGIDVYLKNT
jgi:hypothetical protein